MAAMLHGRNNRFFFLWEQMFFLMQNIFIVPAMQHDCRAKPLFSPFSGSMFSRSNVVVGSSIMSDKRDGTSAMAKNECCSAAEGDILSLVLHLIILEKVITSSVTLLAKLVLLFFNRTCSGYTCRKFECSEESRT